MPGSPAGPAAGGPRAARPDRRRPYYGWAVVAALGTVLAVSVGIAFYGVSVYLEALTKGPAGFSVGIVSLATSLFLLVSGISGVGVAAVLARLDPRWVLSAGAVLGGAAVLALGHVRTPAQLLLAYACLGVGFAATSTIPASTLVTRWFTRRRALALSLTFTGLSIGGAMLTPPITALVQSLGVAGAAPWLAGAYVVGVVPVSVAFVRRGPAPDAADGDTVHVTVDDADGADDASDDDGATPARALRTGWFWGVTAALMLGMLGQIGALSHLFNAVTERFDPTAGAAAISTMALASLAGRVVGSWALGRVRLALTAVVLLSLQGLATLGIAVAPAPATVLATTAAFGLTVGNMQVLHPLLIAERYGGRGYPRILSLSNLGVTTGMAVGPLLVGAVRAGTGSYPLGIAAAAGAAASGAVVVAVTFHRSPQPAGTGVAVAEAHT